MGAHAEREIQASTSFPADEGASPEKASDGIRERFSDPTAKGSFLGGCALAAQKTALTGISPCVYLHSGLCQMHSIDI